jgi:hypothetical protein
MPRRALAGPSRCENKSALSDLIVVVGAVIMDRRRGRGNAMIRKLPSGKYRLYSRKINPKTGKRRNLGTFGSRAAAEKHERAVQYFKRH